MWPVIDCEQSLFCSKIRREKQNNTSVTASMTYEQRRRAKRESAPVLYNDLDATLTGRIIYSLTRTSSFEYDTPVSNYFSREIEASFARFDEWFSRWFYTKEACFEPGEKKEYRSALSG